MPARRFPSSRLSMSFSAFAREAAKSRMVCCCGTEEPAASHGVIARARVSIRSSRAGPHASFWAWAFLERATHSFHTQRQRAHSASSPARAVADTRNR
jgi:hypothetical protein